MKYLTAPLLLYLSYLLDLSSQANALKIHGVRTPLDDAGLDRRSSMSSQGDLRNDGDLKYYTNVALNGEQFPVLIDTGRCVCRRFVIVQ
jgi:hypothetical protein